MSEIKKTRKRTGIKDTIIASILPNGNKFTAEGDLIINIFEEKKIHKMAFVCKFCCTLEPEIRANSYKERKTKTNDKNETTKAGCSKCYNKFKTEYLTISKEFMDKYVNTKNKADVDNIKEKEMSTKNDPVDSSIQYNEFENKLHDNDNYKLITDSTDYKNKMTPCDIMCNNNHEFQMSYNAYTKAKTRHSTKDIPPAICPHCNVVTTVTDETQRKNEVLAKQGTDKLLSEFTNATDILEFECLRPFHPDHIDKKYKSNWNNFTNKNTPIRCECVSTDLRKFKKTTIDEELPVKIQYILDYVGVEYITIDKSTKQIEVMCKKCKTETTLHMSELFNNFKCKQCNK
jgi:hypothetical protein